MHLFPASVRWMRHPWLVNGSAAMPTRSRDLRRVLTRFGVGMASLRLANSSQTRQNSITRNPERDPEKYEPQP